MNAGAVITGDDQVVNASFLDISSTAGFAGLQGKVDPGDGGSQGMQTLNIDGTMPGTDNAITVSSTGGFAQIGDYGSPTPQIISITGAKGDIHIESNGAGAEAAIVGDQQIHGTNSGDAAGAIELISSNGGWSALRGKINGQTILAESLYVEGNSGGYSQEGGDSFPR